MKTGFLSENELFQALTKSAFEFLDRSIDDFSTSVKFSTVNFAIAIELFLKARLMREHWSLLLDKPDQAEKAAFFKGDIKTVSPEQAIERLQKIALVSIPQDAREVFAKIVKHRNKMVHFAHATEARDIDTGERSSIAEEQCAGWFAIRTLLEEWREFNGFKKDITRISGKMEGHRVYLVHIFKSKASELKAHSKLGRRVSRCPSCSFKSVKIAETQGAVSKASCVVCRYQGSEISVKCGDANCRNSICFNSYEGPPSSCPKCHKELTKVDLRHDLDTSEAVTKDNYFDYIPINCPQCSGYHSVVEHHDKYLCVECFEHDDHYGVCGYCSEGQLGGVPEHSGLVGCEFCDGSYKEDD